MDCPVCGEAMVVLELEEVEVDYCLGCGGVWFDEGEVELLLDDAAAAEKLLASFEVDHESKEAPRKCPICAKKMEKVGYGPVKKVLIDRCKKNDGLWFDKGELEEVLEQGEGDHDRIIHLLKEMFKGESD